MAAFDRGRSPSAGPSNHLRNSASTSAHPPVDSSFNAAGHSLHPEVTGLHSQTTSGGFIDPSFAQDFAQQGHPSLDPSFTDLQGQQQQQAGANFSDITFQHTLGLQDINGNSASSTAFPSFDFDQDSFNAGAALDPSLLSDLDPSSLDLLPHNSGPGDLSSLNPMATLQSHSPTPPHLALEAGTRRQSGSPSPHTSPSFHNAQFQPMPRPRNTSESLDPSSAMFPQGHQNEWMNIGAYRAHKRTPSDNLSDISSNNASPYLGTLDSSDMLNAHSSPLLTSSSDPALTDGLGLQGFSLNESQAATINYRSPGHSPGHSPHIMPQAQHSLPPFTSEHNFGLSAGMNGQYLQQTPNGIDLFSAGLQEHASALNQQSLSPRDVGQADHMSPPEISIDYAPPSKPVERTSSDNANSALSPPMRTSRVRAKSDPYAGSRPASPALPGRGRSPSLQPQASSDSLSPFANQPSSRSSSPGRGRSASGSRARSSSNASDSRDYMLDLADPQRGPSSGSDSKRVQKHPATFQCHLCPKRFTRAYNLRSHLRTHTDERPFVCTVCGKAFARQHDRKRHEGLHSGEKKFVCRGQLQSGTQWGCGRRFARADALGRHFRSEAGRVCIRPLLEEEAAERQKTWMEEQQQSQVTTGYVAPMPLLNQPQMEMLGSFLPAALLQQYPALAGLDWNSIPQGPPPDEEYLSGRSSFDASSGGEYYEDISENEMNSYSDQNMTGMNTMNTMSNMSSMNMQQQQQLNGMQPQLGPQIAGFGGYDNSGGYLSDFEGR